MKPEESMEKWAATLEAAAAHDKGNPISVEHDAALAIVANMRAVLTWLAASEEAIYAATELAGKWEKASWYSGPADGFADELSEALAVGQ